MVAAPKNQLLDGVEFKVDRTPAGTWRRFEYPDGKAFAEFTSHRRALGLPLVHYTRGKNPETGRTVVAAGWIAVGRVAFGVFALGQVAVGAVAIGQLAIATVFGLGQASTGIFAIGQLAVGLVFGLGQFATGVVSIGQFGVGHVVLSQFGLGNHVWDTRGASRVAKSFFGFLVGR